MPAESDDEETRLLEFGESEEREVYDPRLQSIITLIGYRVRTFDDEEIGLIEDFILDGASWVISHLVISLEKTPDRKLYLVEFQRVEKIVWETSEIELTLSKAQIAGSPEYRPDAPAGKDYELAVMAYYERLE